MKKIKIISSILAIILCFFCCSCKNKPQVVPEDNENISGLDYSAKMQPLAKAGTSDYKIVLPDNSTLCEDHSASELQNFIKESTSVEIPIIKESSIINNNAPMIAIGNTELFKKSGFNTDNLNLDGFILKHKDDVLIIKGQRDRGTLYGVYDFLEKVLGVRYVAFDYDYIPKLNFVKMPKMDVTEIPTFMLRGHFTKAVNRDMEFASKMRMTTPHQPSFGTEKYGGGYHDDWSDDFHSFWKILPFNKYHKIHPEWFSSDDPSSWQPVLSSGLNDDGTIKPDTETEQYFINYIIDYCKKLILNTNNKNSIIFLGQNDNVTTSKNENCLRQVKLFGGYSGQLMVFMNAVSKAIEDWMVEEGINKEIYFSTFAYRYTIFPPVKKNEKGETIPAHPLVVPRKNVIVEFALSDASYNELINDMKSTKNAKSWSRVEDWQIVTGPKHFFMYDYATNFYDYLSWYPNIGVLIPNLKIYRDIGAKSIVSNAATNSMGWYQESLNTYIFKYAMWNPDCDIHSLISEFNRLYLGEKAGKVIDDLVTYFNSHFELIANEPVLQGKAKLGADMYTVKTPWVVSADTLTYAFINGAYRFIDKARNLIKTDTSLPNDLFEMYLTNLERVEVQIDYMKYRIYDENFDVKGKEDFIDMFFNKVSRLGIERLSEAG